MSTNLETTETKNSVIKFSGNKDDFQVNGEVNLSEISEVKFQTVFGIIGIIIIGILGMLSVKLSSQASQSRKGAAFPIVLVVPPQEDDEEKVS